MVHTNTYIFTYFYYQYLVLFTVVPRNRAPTGNPRSVSDVWTFWRQFFIFFLPPPAASILISAAAYVDVASQIPTASFPCIRCRNFTSLTCRRLLCFLPILNGSSTWIGLALSRTRMISARYPVPKHAFHVLLLFNPAPQTPDFLQYVHFYTVPGIFLPNLSCFRTTISNRRPRSWACVVPFRAFFHFRALLRFAFRVLL